MFAHRAKEQNKQARLLPRVLWTGAWLIQAALWLFMVFLIADYWLDEVPATKNYYDAGIEQGFDSLAGIIASLDPAWDDVRSIKSYDIPNRLNRLQGDTIFKVWTELDEMPTWNSGLGGLSFNQQGRLVWVRRYFVATPPVFAASRTGETSFSVIKPKVELRGSAPRQNGGVAR